MQTRGKKSHTSIKHDWAKCILSKQSLILLHLRLDSKPGVTVAGSRRFVNKFYVPI